MELYSLGEDSTETLRRYLEEYQNGEITDEEIKNTFPEKTVAEVVEDWRDLYSQSPWMLGNCYDNEGYFDEKRSLKYFQHLKSMEDKEIPIVMKANHISSLNEMKEFIQDMKKHTTDEDLLLSIKEALSVLQDKEYLREFVTLATEKKLATFEEKNYLLKIMLGNLDDFQNFLVEFLLCHSLDNLSFRWSVDQKKSLYPVIVK